MQIVEILMAAFSLALGMVLASFLNVCIYRIPKGKPVAAGRSVCPKCGHEIRAWDNIPIVSYFLLKRKCRDCGATISVRYPVVEAIGGVCFLLTWLRFGMAWETPVIWTFACVLILIAFIDLDTQEIPDRFHLIILGLGIASFFLTDGPGIWQRLIGAAVISVPLLVISLATGGFGMGDVKLMAVSGFLLGWQATLFAGFAGCVLAAVVAGVLIAQKKKTRKDKIAFGPYLAIALFAAALYAQPIIGAYLSLFHIY
ncbi:prepilin peptidase [Christensenellaceae bacterium OttesenSCG-928-K19]|nr:prepilin peptidase [Christensenellaceae bacterium OttesenSCG-928-K19]